MHKRPLHSKSNKPYVSRHNVFDAYGVIESRNKEQGVALLTVLLLVVAITVVAGTMLSRQGISLRQYELLMTQDKVIQDIRTAEQLAVALIKADSKVNNNDSLQDVWARPIAPLDYETHRINILIQDQSSRFNINNLFHDGEVDEQALAVFERLLTQVGLDTSLAQAVLDWQDTDSQVSKGGGSEVETYNQGANATLTGQTKQLITPANQPFLSVDELMSVQGFSLDSFNKLLPYITAIPYYTPLNVNTADPYLLSALVEGSSPEQFQGFTNTTRTTPMNELQQIQQQNPWSEMPEDEFAKLQPLLGINSQAFKVLIDVSIENKDQQKHRYATSLISKLPLQTDSQQSKQSPPSATDKNQSEDDNKNQVATKSASDSASDSNSNASSETTEYKIQSFGTRLWTYRPSF